MKQGNIVSKECSQTILAINDTMEILSGKWKVSIIACLCFHPMRYSELLKEVLGISGKMLSRELKELEVNGLIERNVLATSPVAVEYKITEYGTSLKNLTQTIADWGLNHRERIIRGMEKEKG
ncbi:helix-turn-helix transcriptional regulator [Olivibacter sp. SDN3]|uniref:winged helix-turn-helix transcriptional regulator n=1 Tax=Olivibacter sp. SDN3 TaxID=2764720 RepID=UPI001650D892|nr:helix-turn-helix domain-containing protein [Olivibacter sp. SDN3]QNL52296.1 helix-turn-helix transcriptional regulator [Olivibacter sp. SDN3]